MKPTLSSPPIWLRNGSLFPLLFLNGWLLVILLEYLQPMVTIFIAAIILATLIDYPTQKLQQRGVPRGWSLTIVLALGLLLIIFIGLFLIPAIIEQVAQFIDLLPSWFDSVAGLFDRLGDASFVQALNIEWESLQSRMLASAVGVLQDLAGNALGVLGGSLSGGLTLFITIVLTIFMLLGGGQAWQGIMSWFSPWWRVRLSREVPYKLRKFINGQVAIAFGFSVALALIFTLIEVPVGILFGFLIGMASMIPFMGAIAQVSVSVFIMLNNFGMGLLVFAIAFVLGQIVDNVVVPRVMGGIVGLNPIWLLVSVFLGAKLAGVMGVLVAVPIASVVKSIVNDLLASRQTVEGEIAEPAVGE